MNLVIAAALGLGLGIVTGMPLGVINVAVFDASAAGHRRYATGIGIGGALADTIHAALAFLGTGQLVTRRPDLVRILAIAAAAAILAYALVAWRRTKRPTAIVDETSPRAIVTGFLLTLPNPGALTAWVAVAAALWPDATVAEALALACGVGLGSALWFALLAALASRVPRDHRALAIVPRAALVVFVAIAIAGIARS